MKLPIRLIPGSSPPKFEYYQTVTVPGGGVQSVKHQGCVAPSMESALLDLLSIAKQLAAENERLNKKAVK